MAVELRHIITGTGRHTWCSLHGAGPTKVKSRTNTFLVIILYYDGIYGYYTVNNG